MVSTADIIGPQIVAGLDDFGAALTRGFLERAQIKQAQRRREEEQRAAKAAAKAKLAREQRGQVVDLLDDQVEDLLGRGGRRAGSSTRGSPRTDIDIPQSDILQERQRIIQERETEALQNFIAERLQEGDTPEQINQILGDPSLLEKSLEKRGLTPPDDTKAELRKLAEERLLEEAIAEMGAGDGQGGVAGMDPFDRRMQALQDPRLAQLVELGADIRGVDPGITQDVLDRLQQLGGIQAPAGVPQLRGVPQTPQPIQGLPQAPQGQQTLPPEIEEVIQQLQQEAPQQDGLGILTAPELGTEVADLGTFEPAQPDPAFERQPQEGPTVAEQRAELTPERVQNEVIPQTLDRSQQLFEEFLAEDPSDPEFAFEFAMEELASALQFIPFDEASDPDLAEEIAQQEFRRPFTDLDPGEQEAVRERIPIEKMFEASPELGSTENLSPEEARKALKDMSDVIRKAVKERGVRGGTETFGAMEAAAPAFSSLQEGLLAPERVRSLDRPISELPVTPGFQALREAQRSPEPGMFGRAAEAFGRATTAPLQLTR